MSTLGTRRWLASTGPLRFREYALERVSKISDLPEDIREQVDELASEANDLRVDLYGAPGRVAMKLMEAGQTDRVEPSWEVLGRMMEDELLVLMATQLHDASNAVTMSLAPLVEQMIPHIDEHPYAPYIESFGIDREAEPEEFLKTLDRIQPVDPQLHMMQFYKRLWRIDTPERKNIGHYLRGFASTEFTAHSLGLRIYSGFPNREDQIGFANLFVQVAPHSPRAQQLRISAASDATPEQLAKWAKEAPDDALTQELVAKVYQRRGMLDEAKRAYERAAKLSPNCQRYITLANVYRQSGDLVGWRESLEAYLEIPDDGLGHHQIHKEIAEGLMARKEWQEAEPHATAAAESWSSWGLEVASECHEGLGNWEKSEEYIRHKAESYRGFSRSAWYFWCKRRGRGDVSTAKTLAQQYLRTPIDADNLQHVGWLAAYHQLEGDVPNAMKTYQAGINIYKSLWWDMHLGILAKQNDDKQILQEVAARLDERSKSKELARSEFRMQLSDVARRVLQPRKDETVDVDEIEQLMQTWPHGEMHVDLRYFLGEFLKILGQEDKAVEYWRAALRTGPFDRATCTLAGHHLARQSRPHE